MTLVLREEVMAYLNMKIKKTEVRKCSRVEKDVPIVNVRGVRIEETDANG